MRMKCLPSLAPRPSQLGIRQIEEEYQARLATRMQRVRASGGALLLAAATHILLTAAFIGGAIKRGSLFPVEYVASYLGVTVCVLPITCFLVRLYRLSVADAREARAQVLELESLGRKRTRSE